jgi:hypothetical protein
MFVIEVAKHQIDCPSKKKGPNEAWISVMSSVSYALGVLLLTRCSWLRVVMEGGVGSFNIKNFGLVS